MRLKRGAGADEAREVLDGAVALLRHYQAGGVATVPVAEVLVLLGAAAETAPAMPAPAMPAGADPLTGCLPVTPR